MKMITEKQKKFINDIKGVITENGINVTVSANRYHYSA